MPIIVQKFGGTSVANIERIKIVANLVKAEIERGNYVAVAVSAMAGTTDHLVNFASSLSSLTSKEQLQEYDSIIASGEQITSGLLALALQSMGIKARSFLGWQLPFKTDQSYSKARIEEIKVEAILEGFTRNEVAVLAGFQGISGENRITTLGRGGSDTSAVALAAALKADRVDIYTDVDGVYTTDPRIVEKAKKLSRVSYEEMLEMASLGAKVLQTRSVEIAMKYHVPVKVLSSFSDVPGTLVVDEDKEMEKSLVTAVAYNKDEAMITVKQISDKTNIASSIFGPLADAEINVDMIVKNINKDGDLADMTFTVPKSDLSKAVLILEEHNASIGYNDLIIDSNITKVSVVGVGMRSHSGVAKIMFQVLAEKGINIKVISTSEIKISVLIDAEYLELAVRSLHTSFGLDNIVK